MVFPSLPPEERAAIGFDIKVTEIGSTQLQGSYFWWLVAMLMYLFWIRLVDLLISWPLLPEGPAPIRFGIKVLEIGKVTWLAVGEALPIFQGSVRQRFIGKLRCCCVYD